MTWALTGGPGAANSYEIGFAKNIAIKFRRREPSSVTLEFDGNEPNAQQIKDLEHDLKALSLIHI